MTRLPSALLWQVAVPAFVASLAVMLCSLVLAGRARNLAAAYNQLRRRRNPALSAALIGTCLSIGLALLPFGLLAALLLQHLFFGPPLIAQAIVFERQSFPDSLKEVRASTEGQRVSIARSLVVAALVVGLSSIVVAGGLGALLDQGPVLVRILMSVLQGSIFGVLVGGLCAFQVTLYRALAK